MGAVRIQARTKEGTWTSLAQLDHSEAKGYIDSVRSERFLAAVEQHMASVAEQQLREGKIKALPKIEATHLRAIRVDDSAFRVIPAWTPGHTTEQDSALKPLPVTP